MKNGIRFGRALLCGLTLFVLLTLVTSAHAATPQISAGRNFNLFLKPDGSLWAWGYNYYGELGIGTSNATPSPVQDWDRHKLGFHSGRGFSCSSG